MRNLANIFALPTSLLSLIPPVCADARELQWPYNLPRNARYFPEHEEHVKGGLEAQEKLAWQTPIGMRKMSDDPGEKFFLDYWEFGDVAAKDEYVHAAFDMEHQIRRMSYYNSLPPSGNASILLPAVKAHTSHDRLSGRSLFARDFECPTGTQECDNLDSDLCCPDGDLCVNTSEGVGCCPQGAQCGKGVAECDTAAGYQSCPNDDEGGCCLPGSSCADDGCVFYGTDTRTMTLPTSTVRSTPHAGPSTVIISQPGSATTVTVTMSGQDSTETITVTEPTTIIIGTSTSRTCTSGFRSCPATLGGGCCRSDQVCATDSACSDITTTTSATAGQPVRPTSSGEDSDTSVTAADTETTEAPSPTNVEGCPTNYYMCSAVFLGGCCRVDRNCDTTSCPAIASTNVVTSGLTIAAGGGGDSEPTGSCNDGWQTCGAEVGGGCCPSGYVCGTNCINTAPGGSDTGKQAPNSAAAERVAWGIVLVGIIAGTGMVWL